MSSISIDITKIRPFLGRLVVEIIKENGTDYLNKKAVAEGLASKEFMDKLEIVYGDMVQDPVTGAQKFKKATGNPLVTRGKIILLSEDCFGKEFQERFGNDREYPVVGDILLFVPGSTYQLDADDTYHIVDDCKIIGFIKQE